MTSSTVGDDSLTLTDNDDIGVLGHRGGRVDLLAGEAAVVGYPGEAVWAGWRGVT